MVVIGVCFIAFFFYFLGKSDEKFVPGTGGGDFKRVIFCACRGRCSIDVPAHESTCGFIFRAHGERSALRAAVTTNCGDAYPETVRSVHLFGPREQLGGNKYLVSDGLFIAKSLGRTFVEYPVKDAR